jgi:hypothetical protein
MRERVGGDALEACGVKTGRRLRSLKTGAALMMPSSHP